MTDMAASTHIMDSSDQAFMADVVEASNTQPVLVDFWAPWCGPCKTLTPTLEKVVNEQGGKIKLVKINTEEHPGVAGQMGVRSIPSVFAFDKGRPVNGFQGALPESQVRQFVQDILGGTDGAKQLKEAIEQADLAAQSGDIGTAAQLYGAVMEADPTNPAAIAGLARCYLANGDHDRARQILDMAPEDKANDPAIKSVRTALDLMADTPLDEDMASAKETVAAEPENHEARFELAEKLVAQGKNEAAVDHLLTILSDKLDWGEGKAKAKLLEIFEAAGPKDPVTVEGRRRLGSLMFA
nr:thioredoxin [Hyphomonas sp. Mor2]